MAASQTPGPQFHASPHTPSFFLDKRGPDTWQQEDELALEPVNTAEFHLEAATSWLLEEDNSATCLTLLGNSDQDDCSGACCEESFQEGEDDGGMAQRCYSTYSSYSSHSTYSTYSTHSAYSSDESPLSHPLREGCPLPPTPGGGDLHRSSPEPSTEHGCPPSSAWGTPSPSRGGAFSFTAMLERNYSTSSQASGGSCLSLQEGPRASPSIPQASPRSPYAAPAPLPSRQGPLPTASRSPSCGPHPGQHPGKSALPRLVVPELFYSHRTPSTEHRAAPQGDIKSADPRYTHGEPQLHQRAPSPAAPGTPTPMGPVEPHTPHPYSGHVAPPPSGHVAGSEAPAPAWQMLLALGNFVKDHPQLNALLHDHEEARALLADLPNVLAALSDNPEMLTEMTQDPDVRDLLGDSPESLQLLQSIVGCQFTVAQGPPGCHSTVAEPPTPGDCQGKNQPPGSSLGDSHPGGARGDGKGCGSGQVELGEPMSRSGGAQEEGGSRADAGANAVAQGQHLRLPSPDASSQGWRCKAVRSSEDLEAEGPQTPERSPKRQRLELVSGAAPGSVPVSAAAAVSAPPGASAKLALVEYKAAAEKGPESALASSQLSPLEVPVKPKAPSGSKGKASEQVKGGEATAEDASAVLRLVHQPHAGGEYLQNVDGCQWRKNGKKKALLLGKEPVREDGSSSDAGPPTTKRTYFVCSKCHSFNADSSKAGKDRQGGPETEGQQVGDSGSGSSGKVKRQVRGARKHVYTVNEGLGLFLVTYYGEHVHPVSSALKVTKDNMVVWERDSSARAEVAGLEKGVAEAVKCSEAELRDVVSQVEATVRAQLKSRTIS